MTSKAKSDKKNPKTESKKEKSAKVEPEAVQEVKEDNNMPNEDKAIMLQANLDEINAKYLRALADMENLKRQHSLEISQSKNIGKKILAVSLLEFLNTLNISFNFTPKTEDKAVLDFISTLQRSFNKLNTELSNTGMVLIVPNVADTFDAETMQALNESQEEDVKVKAVVNIGYKLDGKVIQPATVMI